jgi:hypothetical protein
MNTPTMKASHDEDSIDPVKLPAARAEGVDLHAVLRGRYRLACDLLGLFHLCARVGCRHVRSCRGNPAACLRKGATLAPAPARAFVRGLLKSQELGLSFEDAREGSPNSRRAMRAGSPASRCAAAGSRRRRASWRRARERANVVARSGFRPQRPARPGRLP